MLNRKIEKISEPIIVPYSIKNRWYEI